MTEAAVGNDEFTAFWNNVLVAKFERLRNILLDGLSHRSQVPLRRLELARGSRAVDVGCGWGDTAIELAKKTGPAGSVQHHAEARESEIELGLEAIGLYVGDRPG